MPFCGFNDRMLEGMDKFHEGLVEAIFAEEFFDLDIEVDSSEDN